MRRFFHADPAVVDGRVVLTGAEAHHAAQVIRLRVGEMATVLDGRGGEFQCVACAVDRREVSLRVEETIRHEPPACRVRLVQAITKGKSFDLILQKAVELGATEIQPLLTERVVARPDQKEFADKHQKWEQVAIEAIKQCGAAWLPKIEMPAPLGDALIVEREFDLRLVAALGVQAAHPRRVFDGFVSSHQELPKSVSIWIGPEGDFAAGELEEILRSGAKAVTLGRRILRSETAVMAALAVVNHELTSPR